MIIIIINYQTCFINYFSFNYLTSDFCFPKSQAEDNDCYGRASLVSVIKCTRENDENKKMESVENKRCYKARNFSVFD